MTSGRGDVGVPGSRGEGGSALLLFPAAVLIVLGLGAVTLDAAGTFLAQRRLADLADTLATDSVAAIDRGAYYAGDGTVTLDVAAVRRRRDVLVQRHRAAVGPPEVSCPGLEVTGSRITVTCTAPVRPPLTGLLPGGVGERRLTAVASAQGLRTG